MSMAKPMTQLKSQKYYEDRLEIYKEMHVEVSKELCDQNLSCKIKGHLSKIGMSLEKYIEFLANTIRSMEAAAGEAKAKAQNNDDRTLSIF